MKEEEIDLAKIDEEIEAMAQKSAKNSALVVNTAFEPEDNPEFLAEAALYTGQAVKINYVFSQVLFKYYMADKTLAQIVEMYRGTKYEFSLMTLQHATKRYKWKERRESILSKIVKETDQSIAHQLKEKINMVNFIMGVTIEELDKDYQKYVLEGGKKPAWIPTSIKDIDTLARLQDFVLSGGVQKHAVKTDSTTNIINTAFIVDDSNALSILKALTDPNQPEIDEGVIEAEFVERIDEDETNNWRKVKGAKNPSRS